VTLKFEMLLVRDLVAVLPDSVRRRAKVFVPDWQKTLKGKVLAVGPKVAGLAPGDRITFGAAKGMESVYNGAAIRIMRFNDVDMVIEEENNEIAI
jgi:hypothetical protein